jgi:hypothetical protein
MHATSPSKDPKDGGLSQTPLSVVGLFYDEWMVLWGSIERRLVPQKRNWLRDSYNRTTSVLFSSPLFITFLCVILYDLYNSKLYYD